MGDNIFSGRGGAIMATVAVVLFLGGFYFESLFVRNLIWVIFFMGFAGVNFWNSKRTGKYRYLVTGVVFILAGVVGLFNIFFFDTISWRAIWLVSIIFFVLAQPIASLFRSVFSDR